MLRIYVILSILMLSACDGKAKRETSKQDNSTYKTIDKNLSYGLHEEGMASYYANKFQGRPTASGVLYDKDSLTAAHKSLPFGTKVKVTMLSTHKSVIIRINDRGPFSKKRVVDLSYRAAKELGLLQAGVAKVKLEVLSQNRIN